MSNLDKYKNNLLALKAWQEGYEEGLDQCDASAGMLRWVIVFAVLIVCVLLLSGCDSQYRYPCQDPSNLRAAECKSPICDADETCTEYLIEVPHETKSR